MVMHETSLRLLKEARAQLNQMRSHGVNGMPSRVMMFKNAYRESCRTVIERMTTKWEAAVGLAELDEPNRERVGEFLRSMDDDYNTKLHQFSRSNESTYLLACLINDDANISSMVNHINRFKQTPLMIAIEMRHFNIAVLLLAHGASSTYRIGDTCPTPLHLAAMFAGVDFVKLLVSHGANAHDVYYDEYTETYCRPVDCAKRRAAMAMRTAYTEKGHAATEEAEAIYEYLLRLK